MDLRDVLGFDFSLQLDFAVQRHQRDQRLRFTNRRTDRKGGDFMHHRVARRAEPVVGVQLHRLLVGFLVAGQLALHLDQLFGDGVAPLLDIGVLAGDGGLLLMLLFDQGVAQLVHFALHLHAGDLDFEGFLQ